MDAENRLREIWGRLEIEFGMTLKLFIHDEDDPWFESECVRMSQHFSDEKMRDGRFMRRQLLKLHYFYMRGGNPGSGIEPTVCINRKVVIYQYTILQEEDFDEYYEFVLRHEFGHHLTMKDMDTATNDVYLTDKSLRRQKPKYDDWIEDYKWYSGLPLESLANTAGKVSVEAIIRLRSKAHAAHSKAMEYIFIKRMTESGLTGEHADLAECIRAKHGAREQKDVSVYAVANKYFDRWLAGRVSS
jgi:hypothetical protein